MSRYVKSFFSSQRCYYACSHQSIAKADNVLTHSFSNLSRNIVSIVAVIRALPKFITKISVNNSMNCYRMNSDFPLTLGLVMVDLHSSHDRSFDWITGEYSCSSFLVYIIWYTSII